METSEYKEMRRIVGSAMDIIRGLQELHKLVDGQCSCCKMAWPCDTMRIVIAN